MLDSQTDSVGHFWQLFCHGDKKKLPALIACSYQSGRASYCLDVHSVTDLHLRTFLAQGFSCMCPTAHCHDTLMLYSLVSGTI